MDKAVAAGILDVISNEIQAKYDRYERVRKLDGKGIDKREKEVVAYKIEALKTGAHCLRNVAQAEKG